MRIIYDEHKRSFSLHTKKSTYQMQISPFGHLLHLYYGRKIHSTTEYLLTYRDRGFSGNPYDTGLDRTYSMDSLPQEFPTDGTGDFRISVFTAVHENGSNTCDFRYRSHEIIRGKYSLKGLPAAYGSDEEAQTLSVVLADNVSGLEVTLLYGVFDEADVITRSVIITNNGQQTSHLTKVFSMALDFQYGDYDWIHFYGRHAMEQNPERMPLHRATQSIGSKRGASSHQHNPFLILADPKTTEDFGDCYGMCLVYSGSFTAVADVDQYHQTRVVMGINNEGFSYQLNPGESFVAPEVLLSYSNEGLTALSHQFHHVIRHHLCRGKYKTERRPILINNWEATYFDFNGDKIVQIAKQAAELGVEMFVLDDGWFGQRNSDLSSLGDWNVNVEKMGCSMKELSQKINDIGMKFGLWFEPEMVSENSDLYREHPDWAFIVPGRNPIRSRHQLVLDLSRKEIVDYLFEKLCSILDNGHIEYVKWDFNRSIADVYSNSELSNTGSILHNYILGLYDLLERIIERYPDLLIESCSGGGGRFDAGMMHYSPQIWTSDNTDALDRIIIQEGASYAYPISVVGSHVSAVPNHQTGRETSVTTRGVVAMAGSFGYELDLSKITDEEKETVRQQIKDYQDYWHVIHGGNYYRLSSSLNRSDVAAWSFVDKDRKECLFNAVTLERHGNHIPQYIRLKGLDENRIYMDSTTGAIYSGSTLMYAGLPIPNMDGEYQSVQIFFKAVE